MLSFTYYDEIEERISDKYLYHMYRVKMRAADFAIKYQLAKATYKAKPKCSR